ncbi:MAG: hypothetical protein ABEH64_01610 [Salinirussus sp.]
MDAAARYHERIHDLADRADADRADFSPPADPPDADAAMEYLRDGAGPAIALYIEARTGGQMIHFPPEEYHALEGAMNTWLELYAACYGVEIESDRTLREAAELMIDTHNIRDVAAVLTHVPE